MEIKKLTPLLKKRPWQQLVTKDDEIFGIASQNLYNIPQANPDGLHIQYYGNAEIYNISCEGAHLINTNQYSGRYQWEPYYRKVKELDEDGNEVERTVKDFRKIGWDEIETVRSGLGEMIIKQKSSHLGKNGIETADELGKDHEAYDTWLAWKDISGVDSAWVDMIYAACKVGDSAIYIYKHGKSIEYSLFSFMRGDILFPQKDDKGNFMLLRMYQLNGQTAVDVYMTDYIETYVQADLTEIKEDDTVIESWWSRVKGWIKNINIKKTEDGWTRISRRESQLDDATCQVAYMRFEEPPLLNAIKNINSIERGMSYVSDKVKSMAFSKLLLKAVKIKSVPPLNSGEEVIAIDGNPEDLKVSTAEYLNPPDISNIATIDLKNKMDAIMQSTMSIDLQPEILKSGADSSQTLKLLLRREIQWCHVMWPQIRPVAQHIVEILKGLVGKLEKGGGERFDKLRISVWNTPWLPQDEDALAERINKYIYNGVMSAESGRHESGMRYTNDARQIAKEQEEKIYRETYTKIKAEAEARKEYGLDNTANDVVVDKVEEAENPAKDEASPKIDNNSPYKNMADNKVNE